MRDVRIFRVEKEDKVNGHQEHFIITAYSRTGLTVHAFDGYSDHVIGRASGGGYDKTHTALAHALQRFIFERDGKLDAPFVNGAAGFEAVRKDAETCGWKLEVVA